MALTKEQIVQNLLPKQLAKRRHKVVWGDVVSAVASANATQKQRLTTSLSNKDFVVAGRTIMEILMDNFLAEIEQDLNQKLANNSLSVDELSEILT